MKRLIHEIHRRSLWQVLGIYLAGSWVALQVVEQLTTAAGLPDWVQPFALVLLVVGLPIVLGTAFVQVGVRVDSDAEVPSQRGEPGATRPPAGVGRWLTWRNATFGAMMALAVLGLSVIGYFTMRATGIGPAASLVARGVIEEGDPILLADFENTSNDPGLGGIVVEALRVDLSNGSAVAIVDPGRIRAALERMGRDPDEPLTAALAHEVAVRDGIKAVLEGEALWFGARRVLTDERLGNLYDQLGDVERAAEHYGRFVQAWADADPDLQPRVRAARARLEEILRDIG